MKFFASFGLLLYVPLYPLVLVFSATSFALINKSLGFTAVAPVLKNIFGFTRFGHSVYPNVSLLDHIEVRVRVCHYHSLLGDDSIVFNLLKDAVENQVSPSCV